MSKNRVNGVFPFIVEQNRIQLVRVGPANAQRQLHNSCRRNMVTGEKIREPEEDGWRPDRRVPVGRGIWAFPSPLHDAFFYSHVWRRHLPKRLRDEASPPDDASPEEMAAFYSAQHAAIKEIRRRWPPRRVWHEGPFHSHVAPPGLDDGRRWHLWTSARDWATEARKHLKTLHRDPGPGGRLFTVPYSLDHLELFVPDAAEIPGVRR